MAKAMSEMFSPQMRPYVDRRWKEWLPWMTMKVRKESDHPDVALANIHETYLVRIHILLQQSIRWPVIRKHNLDNPIVSDDTFRNEMASALTRAVVRRGWNRFKGSRKGVESRP